MPAATLGMARTDNADSHFRRDEEQKAPRFVYSAARKGTHSPTRPDIKIPKNPHAARSHRRNITPVSANLTHALPRNINSSVV